MDSEKKPEDQNPESTDVEDTPQRKTKKGTPFSVEIAEGSRFLFDENGKLSSVMSE